MRGDTGDDRWTSRDIDEATLKKNIVSGPAAECVYYCRMGTFFFHFALKKKIGQNFIIFLPKKKRGRWEQRFCGRPTGHNFGRLLDRKQFFFKCDLKSVS